MQQHGVETAETEPDLMQSQIRFFFLYRKKSWNYARKWWGNSNFCFLCCSVFSHEAAADDSQGTGIGNPIVHLLAIVQGI